MEYFRHDSRFVSTLKRVTRGDACDPIPVAVPLVRTRPVPSSAVVGGGTRSRTTSSFSIVEQLSMPSEIVLTPLVDPASGSQPGAIGLRYCACSAPHGSEAERRTLCGLGTPSNCAIDERRYSLNDPTWRLLSVNGSQGQADALLNATFSASGSSPEPVFQWDALADVARFSGLALPPQPWTVNPDGSINGVPLVQGILWAHVESYRGLSTRSPRTTAGNPPIGQLANAYVPLDIRPRWTVTSLKRVNALPDQPPPWTYCAACEVLFRTPWLWAVNEAPLVLQEVGIVDVAPALSREALRVLARGDLRIGDKTGASTRMLVVDSTTFAVTGALFARGGRIEAEEFGDDARHVGTVGRLSRRAVLAYSAVTDQAVCGEHGRSRPHADLHLVAHEWMDSAADAGRSNLGATARDRRDARQRSPARGRSS